MATVPWYHNAIVYCIDVEKFADGNGDGIGDFIGLAQKTGYLRELGVDCLWLLPFFRSPQRDNGYDVSDYYSIDPRFGTFDDFITFMHEAKERGIRVIVELVMDHTSDEHPWFRAARYDPESPFRDYYLWSDSPILSPTDEPSFPGEVDTLWDWDDVSHSYYFHRFYPFQPNLNLANQEVVDELTRIMHFWLSFGADGFRIDALPLMFQPPGQEKGRPEEVLRQMRDVLHRRKEDELLLAEVDLPPEQMPDYIGDGEHVDMMQNFMLRAFMLLAFVKGSAEVLLRGLDALPSAAGRFQWLSFLTSHDELNLSRLRPDEMKLIIDTLSPDPATHSYGRGLRRRILPLLGDERRYRMLYSLLFSLPGTPMVLYGDELGLGDDLTQEGREAVRVLMQWDESKNGGFSTARSSALVHPPIAEGPFGFKARNVEAQSADEESLLSWFKQLIRLRRDCTEIGYGSWRYVHTGTDGVFALKWDWEGRWLIAAHNLTDRRQKASIQLDEYSGLEYELVFGDVASQKDGVVQLEPYGFAWWRIPYTRR